MKREHILFSILILSAVITVLHFAALSFYLYWLFSWFDILMHFLGGFLIALISICILCYLPKENLLSLRISSVPAMYTILGMVLFVGISWEVFEFTFGLRKESGYILDTTIDLIMNMVGAFSAYFVLWRSKLSAVIQ